MSRWTSSAWTGSTSTPTCRSCRPVPRWWRSCPGTWGSRSPRRRCSGRWASGSAGRWLSFADANDIPWVRFEKDQAKLEVMAPHLARQAATGRSGVAAIGVAQEFQRVWTASEGKTSTGTPRWSFYKADRRVTCYYFYLWDEDFGPAFIKVCA